jgi:hypothetical protein
MEYTVIFKLEMGFEKEDGRYDKSAGALFGLFMQQTTRARIDYERLSSQLINCLQFPHHPEDHERNWEQSAITCRSWCG